MVVICTHEACTGCMACVNVCAHKAITIIQDEEGFERPSIQQNKCVDCGVCQKICPINNPPTLTSPLQVIVAGQRMRICVYQVLQEVHFLFLQYQYCNEVVWCLVLH